MPYSDKSFNIGGGLVGTCNVQLFNLGSLFDPDSTGVGHQPLGYDQLSQFYEQYVVMSVKYKISFVNGSSSSTALVGVCISDSLTTQTDSRLYIENGSCKWKVLGVSTGGQGVVSITGSADISAIHGLTPSEHISAHLTAFGNNPSESAFLHVFAADSAGATAPAVYLIVEITYMAYLKGYVFTALS